MRFVLALGVVLIATPVVWKVAATGDAEPSRVPSAVSWSALQMGPRVADTTQVRAFLDAVRGANPLQCQLGIHSLDVGFGWRRVEIVPDAMTEPLELVQWATRRIEDPDAVRPLRRAMEDADACVSRVATRLLGRMRQPAATRSLVEALRSPNARTRELAALGLGFADDRTTVRAIVALLDDREVGVRAAGAWALGRIESREAIVPLTRLLQTDPDPIVRRAAAWALGAMH